MPLFDLSGFTSGGAPGQSIYVLPGPFPNGPGFTGDTLHLETEMIPLSVSLNLVHGTLDKVGEL